MANRKSDRYMHVISTQEEKPPIGSIVAILKNSMNVAS